MPAFSRAIFHATVSPSHSAKENSFNLVKNGLPAQNSKRWKWCHVLITDENSAITLKRIWNRVEQGESDDEEGSTRGGDGTQVENG